MKPGIRLFGHAIHPMLIVFPLGLLSTAVIFDVVYYATLNPAFPTVAFWLIGAGIIGGLAAAVFGLIDWLAIPSGTRAKRIGLMHAGSNVLMLALFTLTWLDRFVTTDHLPSTYNLLLEGGALAIGMVAGWLGGELVDRLGVGVDDGAHLNAPNSLSGKPAGSVASRPRSL